MIKISHRGNYKGRDAQRENTVAYIEEAIAAGYNVKVDVWLVDYKWYLGFDIPKEEINLSFLERPEIWTHARDLQGYVSLYNNPKVHVLWHNKDGFVFTSKGIKWANTGTITHDGIMFMPDDTLSIGIVRGAIQPLGVCCNNFDIYK